MEWTRELRYRHIEEAFPNEIDVLKGKVANCPWRQKFHIQPEMGLLNDPNGFSWFNGEYHLFYQWFPLAPVHGLKHWYHIKSKNLVCWESVGIGIEPREYFESHGAYSGSALVDDGKLYLMYTGNHYDEGWKRQPSQCMAYMDDAGSIKKFAHPVIDNVPQGYTEHFRDPKMWKANDMFYAVVGAQRTGKQGCALLYQSPDLCNWELKGELETRLNDFGYMWECPDYFELGHRGVLLFCPQGLEAAGDVYQNVYQSGYLIGDTLNVQTRQFQHGEFVELDRGFDFYAPQTMLDPQGRRLLVGWMGLPDIEYPTDQNGWAHCLTLPRELIIKNDRIIQRPIQELQLLRKHETAIEDHIDNEAKEYAGFAGQYYELLCEFTCSDAAEFGIELRVGDVDKTVIQFDSVHSKVVLDRSQSGEAFAMAFGAVRKCGMSAEKIKFHIFVDVSSVEVFVNDGEAVFTARIFPKPDSQQIRFFAKKGGVDFRAVKWDY